MYSEIIEKKKIKGRREKNKKKNGEILRKERGERKKNAVNVGGFH